MLGKTHLVVGIAVSMVILRPDTLPELIVGLGASSVGTVISDIDVGTANAHKDADKICAIAVAALVAVAVIEEIFHLGIYERLMERNNLLKILVGAFGFIGVCAFGKEQPHRSFMHSFLALILLSILVRTMFPMAMPYFALAFLSHLATDIFNFKKVKLWYPLKDGICLKMFHAKGVANRTMFLVAGAIAVVEVTWLLVQILHPHIFSRIFGCLWGTGFFV